MDDKDIDITFNNTIKYSDLQGLSENLLEFGLDEILKDGVLKDLPVFGLFFNSFKTYLSIKDKIFAKKILHFILEIRTIPISQRSEMISKIEKEEKYRNKVGETILLLLDKISNFEKCGMIGVLFNSYLDGQLSYSDFLRGVNAIEKVFVDDIIWFLYNGFGTIDSYLESDSLYSAGFLKLKDVKQEIDSRTNWMLPTRIEYEPTYIGEKVRNILKNKYCG
jgi:hypothetical protein